MGNGGEICGETANQKLIRSGRAGFDVSTPAACQTHFRRWDKQKKTRLQKHQENEVNTFDNNRPSRREQSAQTAATDASPRTRHDDKVANGRVCRRKRKQLGQDKATSARFLKGTDPETVKASVVRRVYRRGVKVAG